MGKRLAVFFKDKIFKGHRGKIIMALAAVIIFTTTYALILPAITLSRDDRQYACPLAVHQHGEGCYEEQPVYDAQGRQTGKAKVLICQKADYVFHEHDENCYQTVTRSVDEKGIPQNITEKVLVCPLPEIRLHQHDRNCYTRQQVLACGLTETAGHQHTDSCYTQTSSLICTLPEHQHTEDCYSDVVVGGVSELICGYEEGQVLQEAQMNEDGTLAAEAVLHHHDPNCYQETEVTERQLTCTAVQHTHDASCYQTQQTLTCDLPETAGHTHTSACYAEQEILTCTQPALHQHTMACYAQGPEGESPEQMGWAWYETDAFGNRIVAGDPHHLVCGQVEILAHQHGAACYADVTVNESEVPLAADPDDSDVDETIDNSETETAAEKPAPAAFKITVPVEGADYRLRVDVSKACGIPKEAAFKAFALQADTADYDAYAAQAEAAVAQEQGNAADTYQTMALFDLSIYDAQGNELQPQAPIGVTVDFGTAAAENDSSELYAVHFPGAGPDEAAPEVISAEEDGGKVNFDAESFSVYAVVYSVDFHYESEPGSFDYSIKGGTAVTLSELTQILGILDDAGYEDVDAFLGGIADVTFSDETLMKAVRMGADETIASVLKAVFDVSEPGEAETADIAGNASAREGDWLLVSLAPFDTAEKLTIVMKDGKEITIDVTDDQEEEVNLADFVTDAVLEIDGRTYGAGETWPVREDVNYALTLTFKEKGSRQFPQGGKEVVMDPDDLGGMKLVPGQSGTFDIPMGLYGVVTGNLWWVDSDGKLHLKFGADPEKLLTRSNNTHIKLEFNVNFTGSAGQIIFNENVVRNWEANTDTDVSVTKSGHYNAQTGKMEYTVTVISTGHTTNIKVTDTFAENGLLTLDQTSITITPNKELAASGNTTGSDGFTRVIKEMSHGEKVTITYTADVNEAALEPNGRVKGDDGKNSVIVTDDQKDDDEDTSIVHEIKFSDLDKVTTSQTETADGKVRMSWEITANTQKRASLVGSTITDRIDLSCKDIMKYARTGEKVQLHVTGTDAAGHTYSRDIEVTPEDNQGQESWTWTVENIGEPAGTPLRYSITYDTIAEKQKDNAAVKNDAENSSGGSDTGVGAVPGTDPGSGDTPPAIVTKKAATAVTAEYIDWNIVINVPAEGFPDGLTVTDYIPRAQGAYDENSNGFADRLIGEPTVTGLTGTETFKWAAADDYGDHFYRNGSANPYPTQTLTIDFYESYSETQNDPGLGAGPRTITISLRTENDPLWLEYAMAQGSGDPVYKHNNTGKVNDTDITAYAIPLKPAVEKEHRHTSEKDGLPVFEYMITLANVTELPVVIEDTFDSDYLEFYRVGVDGWAPFGYIAAAELKYQLNNGTPGYEAVIQEAGPGKIRITADDLPRKENGAFYEYYRIYYCLKVKDAAALADLKSQALKHDGKYRLTNTALWEGLPDECNVDYEVDVVSKDGYFASTNTDERKFTFVIDVNPGAFDLSDGDTVELTDQHTNNLSVDYSSVKIYRIPGDISIPDAKAAAKNNQLQPGWLCGPGTIPWNFTGNSGTFTLPDQTHYVIVYDAIVIGSGKQEFENIAELEGFIDFYKGERTYSSGASAGGDIWEIKLLKFKDGLTSNGLQGATFQLFKGTGEYYQEDGTDTWTEYKEPMKYGDTAYTRANGLVGKDVTFTTDENGLVTIKLNEVDHGNELEGGVHYYLKEIESPAGYQIDSSTEYWSFTLTKDPDEVNYGDEQRKDEYGNRQWIYFYYNDILKMANTETRKPLDVVVNKSWFDKDGNPITGDDLDETFVAKVQLLRKTDNYDYVPVKVETGSAGPVITEVPVGTEDSLVKLTKDNNWSYTWNDLPRVELDENNDVLHRYAYKIEEVEVDGYVVAVSETETETVKTYALKNYKTPDNKTTNVTVNKKWQDAAGAEIPGTTANLPPAIYFELYRAVSTTPFTRVPTTGGSLYVVNNDPHLVDSDALEGQANYGRYKLTGVDDHWTWTFTNLPEVETSGGKTYYYAYYVREIPLEGYTASYTSEGITRTIVNREPSGNNTDISLEKKWENAAGTMTTPPQGASATFTVHQQKAELSSSGSGQGNLTVNLLDMNEELIQSVRASDGNQLLISGYHFKDRQQGERIDAQIDYKTRYSTMFAGNLIEYSDGTAQNLAINITSTTPVIDNVITLKLYDKTIADFSTLPVLSNTSSGGAPTYSEYVDTNYTRTVVLPTADGAWSTTIKDLIRQDEAGNRYRYYITEDSCSPAAASVTFRDQNDNIITDGSQTGPGTVPLEENVLKVEVTNTYETEDFTFTKEWHDVGDNIDTNWNSDITVYIQRRIGDGTSEAVGKYTIHKGDSGFVISKDETTPDAPELVNDNGFTFKISDLPKTGKIGNVTGEYIYFVTEETISGYRDAEYSNPSVSASEAEPGWISSPDWALNHGKIINRPENSVELPSTGGPGTRLFAILGSLLILGAGAILLRQRRI